MKSKIQRLNNIEGQIKGIKKMMIEGVDCEIVLTQLKATRAAIKSLMGLVVEEGMEGCLKSLKSKDKKLLIKLNKYVATN